MKKRLVASVIGICSLLALATPVSAGTKPPAPSPSLLPTLHLCLDLIVIKLPCV